MDCGRGEHLCLLAYPKVQALTPWSRSYPLVKEKLVN
ncbi:hypothetical protein RUM8411_01036 [Ruegeria meonggei]|uniref:Uncharacterized protein n=1 Tax=Ruegeria meonggei TaxID=1446476 RepID=A0A1X6YMC6_9RHOB|nr:hypothetical protein RUM8411_01036 [Ruegeria meonggei]